MPRNESTAATVWQVPRSNTTDAVEFVAQYDTSDPSRMRLTSVWLAEAVTPTTKSGMSVYLENELTSKISWISVAAAPEIDREASLI